MAKGFFTQGFSLLTNGQTAIGDIKVALKRYGFDVAKELPAQENWCFGGPTVVVPFLPEVNGYVAIDVVNEAWPDTMGDPKSDAMMFAAWSMGHFGPFAFPGSLSRAQQHSWTWQPGRTIAAHQRGFVRIRISYVFGSSGDAPVLPKNYNSLAEMMFLNRVVVALFNTPGVLCYFNPSGEVLLDFPSFHEPWEACGKQEKVPLLLWTNIRFFNLTEELGFMDSVGNSQLEISDVEAIFPVAKYKPGDIDYYLRNVTHYLLESGQTIKAGESIDGPGETDLSWTIEIVDNGLVAPPRKVMRLYPKVMSKKVRSALAAVGRSET